jgi:hypothetical protein
LSEEEGVNFLGEVEEGEGEEVWSEALGYHGCYEGLEGGGTAGLVVRVGMDREGEGGTYRAVLVWRIMAE